MGDKAKGIESKVVARRTARTQSAIEFGSWGNLRVRLGWCRYGAARLARSGMRSAAQTRPWARSQASRKPSRPCSVSTSLHPAVQRPRIVSATSPRPSSNKRLPRRDCAEPLGHGPGDLNLAVVETEAPRHTAIVGSIARSLGSRIRVWQELIISDAIVLFFEAGPAIGWQICLRFLRSATVRRVAGEAGITECQPALIDDDHVVGRPWRRPAIRWNR